MSYNRADSPFASWAARSLAGQGLSCWIDTEQLTPGTDWSRAINSALHECDALLLIASAQSLASPYCRREWRSAMAAGKPIVLAAIETISVPTELAGCPVVDMRAWSGVPWPELANVLCGGTPLVSTTASRFRVAKTIAVAALALLVLFVFQTLLVIQWIGGSRKEFLHASPGVQALILGHLLILVGWIVWTTRWSWRMVHRKGSDIVLWGMCGVPFLWFLHGIFASWQTSFVLSAIGIPVSFAMYAILYFGAPEVSAWLPSREGGYKAIKKDTKRSTKAKTQHYADLSQSRRTVRYGLYFAPQDENVATRIAKVMERWGHWRVTSGEPEAIRLLLLSNATLSDFAPLVDLPSTLQPTVCILLSAIAVPERLEEFYQHQWVDYRGADDLTIEDLARWLSESTTEFRRISPGSVPPTATTFSGTAGFLSICLTGLAMFLMYAVLLDVLELAFQHYEGPPLWGEIAGIASAVVAAATAAAFRGRLATFRVCASGFVAAFALLAVFAASQHADLDAYVLIFLIPAMIGFGNASAVRNWLPTFPPPRSQASLAPQPPWRFLARQALLPLLAAIAWAIIYTSGEGAHLFD